MTDQPMPPEPETAHQQETGGGCQQEHCSLSALVAQWDAEVPKKWKEIRDSKEHWIAIYSPQWGHAEDLRRRRETSMEVARWTVEWFKERGHKIECQIMEDGESIGIREANVEVAREAGEKRS